MKKLQAIKTHRFRNNRYKVEVKRLRDRRGQCDAPTTQGKSILINPGQSGEKLLATLLDEAIHACLFEIDNDVVDEISDDIARFLWRAGYRLVED
jgi:hypothetical protein